MAQAQTFKQDSLRAEKVGVCGLLFASEKNLNLRKKTFDKIHHTCKLSKKKKRKEKKKKKESRARTECYMSFVKTCQCQGLFLSIQFWVIRHVSG